MKVPRKIPAGGCPRCGSQMKLNPRTGELWCPECGYKQSVKV